MPVLIALVFGLGPTARVAGDAACFSVGTKVESFGALAVVIEIGVSNAVKLAATIVKMTSVEFFTSSPIAG